MNDGAEKQFTVSDKERDFRLDVFVALKIPSLSRSQIKRMIEEGDVMVNHAPASKAGLRLRESDIVVTTMRPSQPCQITPQDIALNIIYEDHDILVINKAAGMVVHPAPGHYDGTLVNAVLHHCDDLSGINGVIRPGIVHRLDKDTSGVLLVAKNDDAHLHLAHQFKEHEIKKIYQALVFGEPREDEGIISFPVGRHPEDRKKMSTRSRRGRNALTHWQVLGRYGEMSLLRVEIMTGRTHQIRVHLAAEGYAVVGDQLYGGRGRCKTVQDTALRVHLSRLAAHALHAWRIGFVHPQSGQEMEFIAPLPDHMTELIRYLESRCYGFPE
ncbi:MAG: RluA family pseudouridine synthase [Syntrophobacterales bacterium]|nr:RluA family pseudouridine synthase [Syntrophobacterales bacterium]